MQEKKNRRGPPSAEKYQSHIAVALRTQEEYNKPYVCIVFLHQAPKQLAPRRA